MSSPRTDEVPTTTWRHSKSALAAPTAATQFLERTKPGSNRVDKYTRW